MAQGQGVSAGKVVLYVVLGIIAVVIGIQLIQWVFSALWWLLVAGAVVGIGYMLYRAGQRSVGGGRNRRQLPR